MSDKNLTQLEIPHLPKTFNLTDGHVHRTWDERELKIIDRASAIFRDINREMQPELEAEYIAVFYELARQTTNRESTKYLICPTASMSLEIAANYLRLNGMSLALIEPCFDNLGDIFKRHNLDLEVVPEKYLADPELGLFLTTLKSDAICLVSPNNPTGLSYLKENLTLFAKHGKDKNKLLILDASFRFYNEPSQIFDEYALLNKIGVDYIFIEDTGKTWPTHEIKLSILATSKNIYNDIYDIYTDFILNVSPFALKLLTEFVKNSIADKLTSVHEVVKVNRGILYENIAGTFLVPVEKSYTSVAWLKIENELNATQLKEILDKDGIYILPGNYFFWSDKSKGDKFIRVALTRNSDKFEKAAKQLKEICIKIK